MVNRRGGKRIRGRPCKEDSSLTTLVSSCSPLGAHPCGVVLDHEVLQDVLVTEGSQSPCSGQKLCNDLQKENDDGKLDWVTLPSLDKEDNPYGFVPSLARVAMENSPVLVENSRGLKDDVAAVMAIPIVNRPPDLGLDAPEQARFTSHPIPRKKHSYRAIFLDE